MLHFVFVANPFVYSFILLLCGMFYHKFTSDSIDEHLGTETNMIKKIETIITKFTFSLKVIFMTI